MEVAPGVYQLTAGGEGEGGPATHVYWVEGRDGGAFVDAGFGEEERVRTLLGAWARELPGRRARWILISHFHGEHAGGARGLREATGARLAVGHGDVDRVHQQAGPVVDLPLYGGEVFDLGDRRITAIAAPGHTLGNMCYFLEGERLLFTGDHIMGSGSVVVRPDEGGDMVQYLASLRRLLPLNARLILPGHGPVVTAPRAKIEEYLSHRAEREAQVLALLGAGVGDVDAMVARLYAGYEERLLGMARQQVLAHLKKLEAENRVASIVEGQTYRLTK